MIIEAEWLLNYTAEWPKLDQQLEAIEHSLATKDQASLYEPGTIAGSPGAIRCLSKFGSIREI
jgi:hypothetical protein